MSHGSDGQISLMSLLAKINPNPNTHGDEKAPQETSPPPSRRNNANARYNNSANLSGSALSRQVNAIALGNPVASLPQRNTSASSVHSQSAPPPVQNTRRVSLFQNTPARVLKNAQENASIPRKNANAYVNRYGFSTSDVPRRNGDAKPVTYLTPASNSVGQLPNAKDGIRNAPASPMYSPQPQTPLPQNARKTSPRQNARVQNTRSVVAPLPLHRPSQVAPSPFAPVPTQTRTQTENVAPPPPPSQVAPSAPVLTRTPTTMGTQTQTRNTRTQTGIANARNSPVSVSPRAGHDAPTPDNQKQQQKNTGSSFWSLFEDDVNTGKKVPQQRSSFWDFEA